MIDSSIPPADDEAEVSLFGPGVGECVVLHIGRGRWFVIDSCINPDTGNPVAIDYLRNLSVELEEQVIGILITHWHKDHTSGLKNLLETCSSAKLYYSAALAKKEMLTLACRFNYDDFSNTDQTIRDFNEALEYIVVNDQKERIEPVLSKVTLFDDRVALPNARLIALTPSNEAFTKALEEIVSLTPKEGESRTTPIPKVTNLNAVACHFEFGKKSVLLGSDLESSNNKNLGWAGVVASNIYSTNSLNKSNFYKVAHHGSVNANDDLIWENLLIDKPISFSTTFTPGKLPRSDQVKNIQSKSDRFIVTKDIQKNKAPKREKVVERKLKGYSNSRQVIRKEIGHVQIRFDDNGSNIAKSNLCVEY